MSTVISPVTPTSPIDDPMIPPTPSFVSPSGNGDRPSRPLSEISNNSDRRRSVATSLKDKAEGHQKASRPTSEVRDSENVLLSSSGMSTGNAGTIKSPKRVPSTGGLQTLTVNLVDYARQQGSQSAPPAPTSAPTKEKTVQSPPAPPSPSTKSPPTPEKPKHLSSKPGAKRSTSGNSLSKFTEMISESPKDIDSDLEKGVSPLYTAQRASLKPSPIATSSHHLTKNPSSPLPSPGSLSGEAPSSGSAPSLPMRPFAKAKPKWLRRASATPAARSNSTKSISRPIAASLVQEGSLTASASLPPTLPPRKGGMAAATDLSKTSSGNMLPPELPTRGSFASNFGASSSRSKLSDAPGKAPALQGPPALPSRDNLNIRTRIAAWGGGSTGFTRSESSNSIASTSKLSLTGEGYGTPARLTGTAQRALGHAGSAVSKGWAGLRARGVTGSISGMSSFTPSKRGGLDPSPSWSSGLSKKASKDKFGAFDQSLLPAGDGPVFQDGVVKRAGTPPGGKIFGRDLVEAGRAWGATDISGKDPELSDYETRRRACLPALIIRTVEYLEIWGPKEEGIFRISGRSSHVSRLRKEFDYGADLDLRGCHPGDVDPHAVSGVFKSYLRELPSPVLTQALAPKFDAYLQRKQKGIVLPIEAEQAEETESEDLPALLAQLPSANWFLLADIVKLLDLIPRHTEVNRMTLNALLLSLGPSLQITGAVLTELLANKDSLFVDPPPLTGKEAATAVINFGELNMAPPSLKDETLVTSSIEQTDLPTDQISFSSVSQTSKKAASSKLPKQPSLTRLFSSGSLASLSPSKKRSADTLPSSHIDITPPRVDVPIETQTPLLPPLEEKSFTPIPKAENNGDNKHSSNTETLLSESRDSSASSHKSTQNDRPPPTPTPIADRFSNPHIGFGPLRDSPAQASDGTNSQSSTALSSPTNPATVIRRGAPVFFQSGAPERTRSRSDSVTTGSAAGGTKRKDESPVASPGSNGKEMGKVKRLSAGPGSINARDVVRSVGMTV